jgi:lipopolysaccharide export LptBFGC system permease protein LptF
MRTIDRYVIREVIPPFLIALLVFTFILIIPFIIELAEQMIAKGVPWPILGRLMWRRSAGCRQTGRSWC